MKRGPSVATDVAKAALVLIVVSALFFLATLSLAMCDARLPAPASERSKEPWIDLSASAHDAGWNPERPTESFAVHGESLAGWTLEPNDRFGVPFDLPGNVVELSGFVRWIGDWPPPPDPVWQGPQLVISSHADFAIDSNLLTCLSPYDSQDSAWQAFSVPWDPSHLKYSFRFGPTRRRAAGGSLVFDCEVEPADLPVRVEIAGLRAVTTHGARR